jgi:prepilin-type N-terminal cleavage/methylation domain-containing protein
MASSPFTRVTHRRRARGFSLIEVILSIGILAIAIVALLGLLGPSLGAVKTVLDTNAAVSAVEKMNTVLDSTPFFNGTNGPTSAFAKASVYTWIYNSNSNNVSTFFFYNRLETSSGNITPVMAVSDGVQLPGVSTTTSSNVSAQVVSFAQMQSDAASLSGLTSIDGPVIAMTLSISPMAQPVDKGGTFPAGENFYTAPSNGIFPSMSTTSNSNPNAAGTPIAYQEAYLPILVQVFTVPVDQLILGAGGSGQTTSAQIPLILTESNRLFTYTTAKLR